MRNGFLGALLSLLVAGSLAHGQAPEVKELPSSVPGLDVPWQPPQTENDCLPKVGPGGYRFYGNVDYILWWSEKDRPVTSLTADPAAHPGNILMPVATDFGPLLRNGVRADLGMWLNQQQSVGLEMGGFWVDSRAPHDEGHVNDVAANVQLCNQLFGAEAQLRAEVYRGTWLHFDILGGFRYLNLEESLTIGERNFGANVITFDRFGTRNNFYGGQLGAEMEVHYNKLFLDIWGKVALGVNEESVNINGTTLAGGSAFPGGVLATPAWMGNHYRSEFAVVPEFGVNVGYHLTQHLRVSAGYTLLFFTEAARPGEQANALLHATQPSSFPFASNDFWVQGLNLSLEFRF